MERGNSTASRLEMSTCYVLLVEVLPKYMCVENHIGCVDVVMYPLSEERIYFVEYDRQVT